MWADVKTITNLRTSVICGRIAQSISFLLTAVITLLQLVMELLRDVFVTLRRQRELKNQESRVKQKLFTAAFAEDSVFGEMLRRVGWQTVTYFGKEHRVFFFLTPCAPSIGR